MALSPKEIEQYRDRCNALEKSNRELLAEVEEYKNTISGFVDVKTKYESEMLSLKRDYEAKTALLQEKHAIECKRLQDSMEMEKRSVNRKVNIALSSIGVNTFAPEQIAETNAAPSKNLYKQFLSMPNGKDKDEIGRAHV